MGGTTSEGSGSFGTHHMSGGGSFERSVPAPFSEDRIIRSLPLFQVNPMSDVHPFLRLLAWCSFAYFEDSIRHSLEQAGQEKSIYTKHSDKYQEIKFYREPLKPPFYPPFETMRKPLNIPDGLLGNFLETISEFDGIDYHTNPYEKEKRVMDYAAHEWDTHLSLSFCYLVRELRRNKPDHPRDDLYRSFEYFWHVFPFCDFRVEIANKAIQHLEHNKTKKKHDLPYQFGFDPLFLRWASAEKISKNIALRYLWEKRLDFREENSQKAMSKLKRIFAKSSDQSYIPLSNTDLIETIQYNQTLKRTGRSSQGFRRQLPEFYYSAEFDPPRNRDSRKQAIIETHEDIATRFFFEKMYFDNYREEMKKRSGASPLHPLYGEIHSLTAENIKNALIASVVQDFYLMRDFDLYHVNESNNYYLSPMQEWLVCQLAEFEEETKGKNKVKTDILAILDMYGGVTRGFQDAKLLRLTRNPYLEPRVCALHRIFTTPKEEGFEGKLKAIGLPFDPKDRETISEMENLIEWLEDYIDIKDDKDRERWYNATSVANLYLAATLKEYMVNFTGKDYEKLVARIDSFTKKEIKNIPHCPELFLVATFSGFYNTAFTCPGFDNLQEFPFSHYEDEINEFRFGEKRIERRAEFIADFPSIMDNYNYIRTGQWAEDLKKELDRYVVSSKAKPANSTLNHLTIGG